MRRSTSPIRRQSNLSDEKTRSLRPPPTVGEVGAPSCEVEYLEGLFLKPDARPTEDTVFLETALTARSPLARVFVAGFDLDAPGLLHGRSTGDPYLEHAAVETGADPALIDALR